MIGHVLCRGVAAVLLFGVATWAAPAAARIDVVAEPVAVDVPATGGEVLRVSWRAVLRCCAEVSASGTTVRSTAAVARAGGPNGPVLANLPQVLTATAMPARVGGVPAAEAVFTETLRLPADVLIAAQRQGYSRVVVQRRFEAVGAGESGEGQLLVNFTGGRGGPFEIARLALRFCDGSQIKIAPLGDGGVQLFADIAFNGSGLLQAQWEIAEPATTLSTPVFRPLSLVRKLLIGDGQRVTLSSPVLPAQQTGQYIARLRVDGPGLAFATPQIRYFVGGTPSQAKPPVVAALPLRTPADGALLSTDTRFAWANISGAASYQLELRLPGTELSTGLVLPGDSTERELTPLAHENLVPGRRYQWRVQAFDAEGRLIAESADRGIDVH